MADNGKKKLRWRYFIDKPFQIRFILRFTILILVGLALSVGVLAYFNSRKFDTNLLYRVKNADEIATIQAQFPGSNAPFYLIVDMNNPVNTFQIQLLPMILMSILYLLMIIIFGLFISHKMAGPVYRIKKTLREVADGKVSVSEVKFSLRKRDELKDLVDSLNDFLDKTNKK